MDPITFATAVGFARKYWWIIALILACIAAIIIVPKLAEDWGDAERETGRLEERTDQQEGVIDNVKRTQEGEREISNPNLPVKYCQCVRSVRGQASVCLRYLPEYEAADGSPPPTCGEPN